VLAGLPNTESPHADGDLPVLRLRTGK
jgi:hypothetical protein